MIFKIPKIKLGNKIAIIYFTLSLLSLLAFNLIWLLPSLSEAKKSAADLQMEVAKRGAAEIEAVVENKLDSLAKITYFLGIEPDVKAQKDILNNFLQKEQDFFDVALLDQQGGEIIRVSQLEIFEKKDLRNQAKEEYYLQAIKGQSWISGVFFSEKAEPYVILSTPVYSGQEQTRGVLVARLKLSEIWRIVSDLKSGTGSRAFVVDSDGRLIADPNPSLVLKNTTLVDLPPVREVIGSKKPFDGLGANDRYQNNDKEWVLAVAVPLVKFNWGLVVERPESEAFGSISQKFNTFFLITILGGISIFIAARLIAVYLIGPLKKLDEGVKIIGSGNLDYRVALKTGDEIEDLAKSFNEMAEQVKETYLYLEKKVDERTRELKTQRDQLDQTAKKLIQREVILREAKEQQEKVLVEVKEAKIKAEEARLATLNILEDIEEARRSLETEKNKVTSVFKSLTDGLIMLDQFGWVTLVNSEAEKMLRVKKEDLLAKRLSETSHPDLKKISDLMETEGRLGKREFPVSGPDENVFEISTVPVEDVNKKIIGQLIILHNVTREKAIERMKSEFVTVAAHQLRTPLSAIKWTLRLILDQDLGPISKEQADTLQKGYQSNERMINLVNDLLNIARIEEGKFVYGFEKVSFPKFLEETVESFAPIYKMKNISLKVEKTKDCDFEVELDKEKMKLVLQNLIENAYNYSASGSNVTISLDCDKMNLRFAIRDQGMGIPKEQQNRVFSKFFRGSNAIRQETEGTGLGLFLVKNIIEKHNGKIWFESERDKGTTFHFTLPLKK